MKKIFTILAALILALPAFSQASVTEIIPANNTTIPVEPDGTAQFQIDFSAPVTILSSELWSPGMGGLQSFPHVPAPMANIETKNGREYADSWLVTFTKEFVSLMLIDENQKVMCNVTAVDINGNSVSYDYEGGILYMIPICYTLDAGVNPGMDFEVIIPEQAYGKLSSFTVKQLPGYNSIGAGGTQMWDEETETIYDITDQITITGEDFEAHATLIAGNRVLFSPAIEKSGSYQVFFPYHEFAIEGETGGEIDGQGGYEGTKFYWSMEKTYDFTITILDGEDPNPGGDEEPTPSFKMPEPKVYSYNIGPDSDGYVTVVWGYYMLQEYEGGVAMTATVTLPDGTVVEDVEGVIDHADGTAIEDPDAEGKPSRYNALTFSGFLPYDSETESYIPQYGEYSITIPEGTVLVNGYLNPEGTAIWVAEEKDPDQPDNPGEDNPGGGEDDPGEDNPGGGEDDPGDSGAVEYVGVDGEYVIYNLQGVRLQGPVEELPSGIYIVNGKKIVL